MPSRIAGERKKHYEYLGTLEWDLPESFFAIEPVGWIDFHFKTPREVAVADATHDLRFFLLPVLVERAADRVQISRPTLRHFAMHVAQIRFGGEPYDRWRLGAKRRRAAAAHAARWKRVVTLTDTIREALKSLRGRAFPSRSAARTAYKLALKSLRFDSPPWLPLSKHPDDSDTVVARCLAATAMKRNDALVEACVDELVDFKTTGLGRSYRSEAFGLLAKITGAEADTLERWYRKDAALSRSLAAIDAEIRNAYVDAAVRAWQRSEAQPTAAQQHRPTHEIARSIKRTRGQRTKPPA
jgi:hypothetical protein